MSNLPRSFIFFLLIASFGVLFVGCSSQPDATFEEFTFNNDDLERVHTITASSAVSDDGVTVLLESSDSTVDLTVDSSSPPTLSSSLSSSSVSSAVAPVIAGAGLSADTAKRKQYDAIRASSTDADMNLYRVNNAFLNVRSAMSVNADQVARLLQGEMVTLIDLPSAQWAKVRLADKREGYVAFRYIAKLTTEAKLASEKKKYEGKYFVNFAFLNVRKEPSAQSEKIAEIPGQTILSPLSINGEWAKVSYQGKEGYASSKYLEPFLPSFLVRQEEYLVPILQYRANEKGSLEALKSHSDALKKAGRKLVTLASLKETILAQEQRDARMSPGTVVITIAGVTSANVKEVGDALKRAQVPATLFIVGKQAGISGITEKTALNLQANGNDLQSGGFSGDDLRSLTDQQLTTELLASKKAIEDISHREVYAIAYPQGGVNDRVMGSVAASGYLFGIGQAPDTRFSRSQFLRLPSMYVGANTTSEEVVAATK